MIETPISNLSGHLLVATPHLTDIHFSKSVIYICEHGPNGVKGIIVNKPLDLPLHRIFQQLGIEGSQSTETEGDASSVNVLMGGPVGTDHGFILYNDEAAEEPEQSVSVSTSQRLLGDIARGAGPNEFIISLGYAGWDTDQLTQEIRRNDWLIVPLTRHERQNILFNLPTDYRWHAAASLLGYQPHQIHHPSGDSWSH